MKKIRIGIIGTGQHTQDNVIPALREVEGVAICAVQSRDLVRAQAIADRFGIPVATNDVDRLFLDTDCDAVVAATIPEMHERLIHRALKIGKNIFVEKPPATDYDSMHQINKAASNMANPPVVQFGFNFRHSNFYQTMSNSTDGCARPIVAMRIMSYASKPISPMWNYGTLLESSLYAVHIHAIEMLCYSLGEVIGVDHRTCWVEPNRFFTVATLSFVGGKVGVLELSNLSNRFEFDVEAIDAKSNVLRCSGFDEFEAFGPDYEASKLYPKSVIKYSAPFLKGGYDRTGYSRQFELFRDSIKRGRCDMRSIKSVLETYKVIKEMAS